MALIDAIRDLVQQTDTGPQALAAVGVVAVCLVYCLWRPLHRAVLREVLRPAGIGLLIFVVLFISNALLFNYMEFLLNYKVPGMAVTKVMLYQLPAIATLAVPVSFLLGVVLGLGRMGQDLELLAIRIGGISYWRVCLPVYAVALAVSALVLIANQTIVPIGNRRSQDILREYLFRAVVQTDQVEKVVTAPGNRVFILGKGGKDMLLFDGGKGDGWPTVYAAKGVQWAAGDWQLDEGQVLKFDKHGLVAVSAGVSTLTFNFEQPKEYYGTAIIAPEEKTIQELRDELANLPRSTEIGRDLLSQIHQKLTLPLATLCFALIGAPLTIASARIRYGAFLFSVLAAGMYYVGMGVMPPLAKAGVLSENLAAWQVDQQWQVFTTTNEAAMLVWVPTVLFVLLGTFLTWRLARR